jgi:hypothetical protein
VTRDDPRPTREVSDATRETILFLTHTQQQRDGQKHERFSEQYQ